jgi:vancomycin resistance protein YoaR
MRKLVLAVAVFITVGAVSIVGWFLVERGIGSDRVGPNVVLDGRSVGLLEPSELATEVDRRATVIEEAPVEVVFGDASVAVTAADLGVLVDRDATAEAVMDAGRAGGLISDFVSWARGPWVPREVSTVWSLDVEIVESHLRELPVTIVAEPVEPGVELGEDGFVAVPASPGARLDAGAAAELVSAAYVPAEPIRVESPLTEIPTVDTDDQAEALASRLNDLTDGGVTVRLLGGVGRLSEGSLRRNLDVSGPVSASEVAFDRAGLQAALFALFDTVSRPGSDPVFEMDDAGAPVLVEAGSPAQGCCGPDSGAILVEALEAGVNGPVEIPATDVDDARLADWAAGADVGEIVGTFTTEHACCEARVTNIHRIADLVRGQYLLPGDSFSVNGFVGRRTIEGGFVAAGVIERGRFTDSVGGGISQFATTLFNAAFFAGLELDEYQSHSLYISRYPYGREATLSFPKPDLKITNSSDYPVLLWPTYTDTSITVDIYSTSHIEVEEIGQEQRPFNRCTDVETFRQRTYPDGRVVEDSVVARYRPGEGLDCNGNPTPQP